MRLQISPSTQRMLIDAPNYIFDYEDRYDENGELGVEVKGKGRQHTYWVNSAKKAEIGNSRNTQDTDKISDQGQDLYDNMIKVIAPGLFNNDNDEAEEC
jgi:hypothetical protein